MSEDTTKKGGSQSSSLPPALTEVDSGWDDDVDDEAQDEGSAPSDAAPPVSERPTVIPAEPLDQMVKRLMEQDDDAPLIEVHGEHLISSLDEIDDIPFAEAAPARGPTADRAGDAPLGLDSPFVRSSPPSQRGRDSLFETGATSSEPPAPSAAPEAPPPSPADKGQPLRELRDRYITGDFSGALEIAEALLAERPDDAVVLRYFERCRDVLMEMYVARLGALDQVVTVSLPRDKIRWLSLDHRAGFLLSLVDGRATIEEILDVSGMPRLDAMRILLGLHEQNVIALERG